MNNLLKYKNILIAVVIFFLATVYYFYDPSVSGNIKFPKCPFLVLTGYKCPGCGSQRALHALLNFKLADVVHYNALFVPAIPYLILLLFALWKRNVYPEFHNRLNSYISCIIVFVVVVAWWILRNIFDW